MDKHDRDFLIKISKKVDEAVSISKKALKNSQVALKHKKETEIEGIPIGSTTTNVTFEKPEDLKKNTPLITKLNQDIDDICKKLEIKELTITYKKQ